MALRATAVLLFGAWGHGEHQCLFPKVFVPSIAQMAITNIFQGSSEFPLN